MTTRRTIPLLTPEEIAARAGRPTTTLLLPERGQLFAERETRLRQCAAGHPMRDYLLMVAALAQQQHMLLQSYPAVALADAEVLQRAMEQGQAPLDARTWPRDPAWITGLERLLAGVLPSLPPPAARVATALRAETTQGVERLAERLLHGLMLGEDVGAAPFVTAALQAYWTHLVLSTHAQHTASLPGLFGLATDGARCPCCASLPVASVVRIDPGSGGLRFLSCSLCSAQWHMVRVKCTRCASTKGIQYRSLAPADAAGAAADTAAGTRPGVAARAPTAPGARGDAGRDAPRPAIEAETCDECHGYLKIVYLERDPHAEPHADDLASVTLDLLVGESGYDRNAGNPMLVMGDG